MIKIAICDDEQVHIDSLTKHLEEYMNANQAEYSVEHYSNGSALLNSALKDLDIIFLDVQMDNINGITVAEKIKSEKVSAITFFISSQLEYACEGYKVGVERFLLKSKIDTDFDECMDYAMLEIEARRDMLEISVNFEIKCIPVQSITYVESKSRKLIVHTNNPSAPSHEYYDTLQNLSGRLRYKDFIRCHQSFLVNAKFIMNIKENNFVLLNGETISISKNKLHEVKKQYAMIVGL